MKVFAHTAKKMPSLYRLAQTLQTGTLSEAREAVAQAAQSPLFATKGWQVNLNKLAEALQTLSPRFSVFALGGNSKLPFVAFSSLPGVTCPGAGACLDFCYSFRAWRYPAAFARQAQNAVLLRFNPDAIAQAFASLNHAQGFDFRLYVDGDFASLKDIDFWQCLLRAFPTVRAYGYSKSFALLLAYEGAWAGNYVLNVSSGHNATGEMLARVKALPIVRGEFVAVSIGRKVKSTDHGTIETNKALRESFGAKAFPCPGKCGSCTGKGHACGMLALRGLPIVIAVH